MSQTEQARRFAAALLGNYGELLSGLQITLSTLPGPSTRWLPAQPDTVAGAILAASPNPATIGVFLTPGLTRCTRETASGERLVVADVAAITELWSDIDVAGGAHGHGKNYPPDKATAIELARSTGLPPTSIADTGHGIQPHWRLRDPLIFGWDGDITDDGRPVIDESRVADDRTKAQQLTWSWVTTLRIHAQRAGGWSLDPVGDLARLVRAPGSWNRKIRDDPRPAKLIECDPSRAYDLDEITAVLAPDALLKPYRSRTTAGTPLEGVDEAGLWAALKSRRDHTPDWLTDLLLSGWAEDLEEFWSGAADARLDHDGNRVDMALARWILRRDMTPAQAAEAIYARRLRSGDPDKIAKVDPTDRRSARPGGSYVSVTISKVLASLQEESDTRAERIVRAEHDLDAAQATAAATPEPVAVGVLTLERRAAPDTALDDFEPPPSEPEPERPLAPLPPLRAAPAPLPDAHQVYADAPREPRGGIDDPNWIQGPTPDERSRILELTSALGLPDGITAWAVGMRRMADRDEIRIWLYRGEGAVVHGGEWPVGTVRPTRWHAKREWLTSSNKAAAPIQVLLLEDLHIVCKPAQDWKSSGLLLLFDLARTITEGTPAAVVQLAISEVLGRMPGTSVFAQCVDTGEPWVTDDEVWVRFRLIRDEVRQSGMTLAGLTLTDVLGDMGCRIVNGLKVPDPHGDGQLYQSSQWVRLPDVLPGVDPDFWAGIRIRARQNDEDVLRARRELRPVAGGER